MATKGNRGMGRMVEERGRIRRQLLYMVLAALGIRLVVMAFLYPEQHRDGAGFGPGSGANLSFAHPSNMSARR